MSLPEIVLIAVGLGMDAFAASVTSGIAIHRLQIASGNHSRREELREWATVAVCFGIFQALMPVIGWYLGSMGKDWIEPVDHWIAFVLLALVGGHMIWEAMQEEEAGEDGDVRSPTSLRMLIVLGVATSIDALAVGISIAALGIDIWHPALIIGLVTAAMCLIGTWAGDNIGHLFERKLELLGGALLILIGLKILMEHLLAG